MNHMVPQLLFVGGPPRSGTTLVQNILDSHPRIVGLPEFIVTPQFVRLRRRLLSLVEKQWIDSICSSDDVDIQLADAIRGLLTSRIDTSSDVQVVSEKTPENCLIFRDLADLFPDAKFVLVVRDPRAVVASLLRVGRRSREQGRQPVLRTASFLEALRVTTESLQQGLHEAERLDRVLVIQYEELVSDTEAQVRRLCGHIGVDYSNMMLHPEEFEHAGEYALTNKGTWYTPQEFRASIHSTSVHSGQRLGRIRASIVNRITEDQRATLLGIAGSSWPSEASKSWNLIVRIGAAVTRWYIRSSTQGDDQLLRKLNAILHRRKRRKRVSGSSDLIEQDHGVRVAR